ncbi:MAZ protein, partial [Copsychus sechellarum]|nr:MAZ protein [Copsychus sechellarum]
SPLNPETTPTSPQPVTSEATSPVTSPRKPKGKGAPYVCGLCAKEFKNGYNLRRHQATHGGAKKAPKPSPAASPPIPRDDDDGAAETAATPKRAAPRKSHACDTCGKAFRDVYHLKRHRLSHTDERPFQCPVCQQRFK